MDQSYTHDQIPTADVPTLPRQLQYRSQRSNEEGIRGWREVCVFGIIILFLSVSECCDMEEGQAVMWEVRNGVLGFGVGWCGG